MPGTEIARKQHALGGAAGIAVLALALAYRFFPGLLHMEPQLPQQVATTAPTVPTTRTPATNWVAVEAPPAATTAPIAAAPAVGTSLEDAIRMGPPAPTTKLIAALLKKARGAEEQGKVLEPKDGNAVDLYKQVLVEDPTNDEAADGLDRIAGALRDWTLAAFDRGDEAAAQRYVTAIADIPHEEAELKLLRDKLATLHKITPLLTHAATLMKAGVVTEPAGDNALVTYRKVLALDPENKLADAGLAGIERSYLDRALAAAAQDKFTDADAVLAQASSIRPGSRDLLETRARIDGIRKQRAETVLAQAHSALDAGNADLAEEIARRAQAISPDLSGLDEFAQRIRNARLYASLKPGQEIRDRYVDIAGEAPAVVVVPTGEFVMGSPADETGHADNEEPQRRVRIDVGFALGRNEVTVGEFADFVRSSKHVTEAEKVGASAAYDETSGRIADRRGVSWRDDYRGERAALALPVVHVSWNDAQAYLAWLSQHTGKHYRLPSEAEFEYAVRAGSAARFPWGDGNPDKAVGNFTGEGDRSPSKRSWSLAFPHYSDGFWGPAPVRTFAANRFGLFDMEGNVSEWTEDCWHDNYVRAPRDSDAWVNPGCERRVVRGGSWGSDPLQVRSAFRIAAPADTRSARVGFRVARDL
ncbi:MAG TPA: SUMF1/EgtB/PvdO family nonheme iron enzyme [Rhodanobacteraceae bacterium]|nr:SUMF1/EgtB/PvdO family nonheme iron enzyme [Rhodanobacteraceae bacterium]